MLVAAVSCALFALRVFKFKNHWDALDLILLLNLIQILIAFITHPFGLKASGFRACRSQTLLQYRNRDGRLTLSYPTSRFLRAWRDDFQF